MTTKQKKFIKEYQATGNGRKAVIAAGYNVSSPGAARVIASQNLQKPAIKSALERNVHLFESAIVNTVKDWKDSDNTRRREIAMQNAQYGHDKIVGKATQRIETKNTSVEVKLDLSGIRLGTHYEQIKPKQADDPEAK